METSLHRALKQLYADDQAQFEVRLGDYRIDAVRGQQLVEIQHGSLGAIRDKLRALLESHEVLVVKPIVVRKTLVKLQSRGGSELQRRRSPKTGRLLDLFEDLVHFTRVFPHPRLTLDVLLVDIEEHRYPGHGRRRRWRRGDHQVEDQTLQTVRELYRFRTAADLAALIPANVPAPFHTAHLAATMEIRRWEAQRIAYCLRQMGIAKVAGKQGNTILYALPRRRRKAVQPLALSQVFGKRNVA